MAVYTTGDVLKRLHESRADNLVDCLCYWHGGPTEVSRWINGHLGTRYTPIDVMHWRQRGVPKRVRWHALATALSIAFPGDARLVEALSTVLET